MVVAVEEVMVAEVTGEGKVEAMEVVGLEVALEVDRGAVEMGEVGRAAAQDRVRLVVAASTVVSWEGEMAMVEA